MPDFTYGPVEVLLVGIGDSQPSPALIDALTETLETGTVRLIDLVFVSRRAGGELVVEEVEDVADRYGFGALELEASGLAGDEDLNQLAEQVPPGTTAAVVTLEHTWARRLATALSEAGGEVLASERIPAAAVNDLLTQIRS